METSAHHQLQRNAVCAARALGAFQAHVVKHAKLLGTVYTTTSCVIHERRLCATGWIGIGLVYLIDVVSSKHMHANTTCVV